MKKELKGRDLTIKGQQDELRQLKERLETV